MSAVAKQVAQMYDDLTAGCSCLEYNIALRILTNVLFAILHFYSAPLEEALKYGFYLTSDIELLQCSSVLSYTSFICIMAVAAAYGFFRYFITIFKIF